MPRAASGQPMPRPRAGGKATHDPAMNWIVLGRHNRRGMRPGLEETPLLPEQGIQVLSLIRPNPAEDDDLVARRDHAGGVELQATELPDNLKDSVGIRLAGLTRQSLARDRQPPRRRCRDGPHERSLLKVRETRSFASSRTWPRS